MSHKYDKLITLAKSIIPPVEEWEMRTYHFTFALYKKKIVSIGINSNKSHPINLRNRKFNHGNLDYSDTACVCSEWACMNKIKKTTNIDYDKLTIINVRVDRNGNICNSKPCVSCRSLLAALTPKKVFYTTDKGDFAEYCN